MAVKPATLVKFKNLVIQTNDLDKQRKQLDRKVTQVRGIMADAIKNGDKVRVGLALKVIQVDIKKLDTVIDTAVTANDTLLALQQDDEFIADRLADVDKLAKVLDDARAGLGRQYESLKKSENEGEAALKAIAGDSKTILIRVAATDRRAKSLIKDVAELAAKSEGFWKEAVAAREARDQKAMDIAVARMEALSGTVWKKTADLFKEDLAKFSKEAEGFPADLKATVQDAVKDLLAELKPTDDELDTYVDALKRAKTFKIEPVDSKKTLTTLGLEGKWASKLDKVLEGPSTDLERGLGALAKEAKLDKSGKDLLALLKKAKLL